MPNTRMETHWGAMRRLIGPMAVFMPIAANSDHMGMLYEEQMIVTAALL